VSAEGGNASTAGAAPTAGTVVQTQSSSESRVEDTVDVKRARALNVSLGLSLTHILSLAAIVVLASLQGGFVNRREAYADPQRLRHVDSMCDGYAPLAVRTLAEESVAAEELLVFHRTPGTSAGFVDSTSVEYRDARATYIAAVESTDAAIEALVAHWAATSHQTSQESSAPLPGREVPALLDAGNVEIASTRGNTGKPWALRQGSAAAFARRIEAAALPSLAPSRLLDVDSLDVTRNRVLAGTSAFLSTPAYGTLARSLASVCSTAAAVAFGTRPGDASTAAAVGATGSAQAGALLSVVTAAAFADAGLRTTFQPGRLGTLYEAAATRATMRSFPVQIPRLGAASLGAESALPVAFVASVASAAAANALSADLAKLDPLAVSAIRDEQRVLLGNVGALLGSSASIGRSTTELADAIHARTLTSFVALWLAVGLAALAATAAIGAAVYERAQDTRYDQLGREMAAVDAAVARMRTVVGKVKCLKLGVVSSVRRKVRLPRPEELALYSALVNLRDSELFLPATVTNAPREAPALAFNQDALYVRPKLHQLKRVIALRVDLAQHHRKFNDVDAKKQAVHHGLVRFLTTVEEAVQAVVPSAVVQHFGAYSLAFLNLREAIEYPASAGLRVAAEVTTRTVETFSFEPQISVALSDITCGNVGALTAIAKPEAMVMLFDALGRVDSGTARHGKGSLQHRALKSFTTFGSLNEDMIMLAAVSKLHNANTVCSRTVVRAAAEELKACQDVHGARLGEAAGATPAPLAVKQTCFFRALELVTSLSATSDGFFEPASSPYDRDRGESRTVSDATLSVGMSTGDGDLRVQIPNARVAFEVRQLPPPGAEQQTRARELARGQEWNGVMRAYTHGDLQQAKLLLAKYSDKNSRSDSVGRVERLIAVAEHLHGAGTTARPSSPFVASYQEVMRDALVECS
jgi:hypothetical protein